MANGLRGRLLAAAVVGLGAWGVAALGGSGLDVKAAGSGSTTNSKGAGTTNKDSIAIFAGGCFWCMEQAMEKLPGVKEAISGYIGGPSKNATYKQVSGGGTGHTEAVKVLYDAKVVSYAKLLDAFWRNIDPLVKDRQFCDGGSQYRAGVFYLNDDQKSQADATKAALVKSKRFSRPIVTEVTKAGTFYPAEGYHQDYYKKNPLRYKYYKYACGRAKRLEQLWGPPAKKAS